MKTMHTASWRCWRQAGLTLIEVVAAIAILGSVLTAVVVAKTRHTRQLALAERRAAAVRAADALLHRWSVSGQGFPVQTAGPVSDDASLTWQTSWQENRELEDVGVRTLRLRIHDANAKGRELLAVDLLLDDPQREGGS